MGKKPAPLKVAGKAKAVAKAAENESLSPTTRAAIKAVKEADAAELAAPTLRRSTMQRVEEAQKERQEAERLVSFVNCLDPDANVGLLLHVCGRDWAWSFGDLTFRQRVFTK